MVDLGAVEWKVRLKGTALARAKRAGLLRNAALVLGTNGSTEAIAPLATRLDDGSEDASVRASAAWRSAESARATHCPPWRATRMIPNRWYGDPLVTP